MERPSCASWMGGSLRTSGGSSTVMAVACIKTHFTSDDGVQILGWLTSDTLQSPIIATLCQSVVLDMDTGKEGKS